MGDGAEGRGEWVIDLARPGGQTLGGTSGTRDVRDTAVPGLKGGRTRSSRVWTRDWPGGAARRARGVAWHGGAVLARKELFFGFLNFRAKLNYYGGKTWRKDYENI